MHELAISEAIVTEVCEHVGAAKVMRVVVEIGKLSAIVPDAVQFCWQLAGQDTAVDGAALEIIQISGLGRCRPCGAEVALEDSFIGTCADCGSIDIEIVSGNELRIRSVEVV